MTRPRKVATQETLSARAERRSAHPTVSPACHQ